MTRLLRPLSVLMLGLASLMPAGEAAAMCGGNVFATCKPRPATVQPAATTKPAAPTRRRKTTRQALRR